jgi:predicted amidohydrolase
VAFDSAGTEVARYCKMHPFTHGGEAAHFEPGSDVVHFSHEAVRIAPVICYDLRFPELFRHAVRSGVHLFAVIANWPRARHEHWTTLLKARAIENQAFVLGVNRTGRDPRNEYGGGSLLIDPRGVTLADAGGQAGLMEVEIDLQELLAYRRSFPVLPDIRDDLLS